MTAGGGFADPQRTAPPNKQRHPTPHPAMLWREDFAREQFVTIITSAAAEGKAESDNIGIFPWPMSTGNRREKTVGALTGAKADSVNQKSRTRERDRQDRRVLT